MMPKAIKKWKRCYEASRKYNPKWEDDFSWLSEASIHGEAFCKLCQCSVKPKRSNLKQHESTTKHKKRVATESVTILQNLKVKRRVSKNNTTRMEENELQSQGEEKEPTEPEEENGEPQEEEMTNLSKENQDEGEEDLETTKDDQEEFSLLPNQKQEVMQFDTSEEFAEVFGSKTEFDSWDEFTKYLEEFQTRTGTYYKPRSACSVEYANERRINGAIPERFVYANVKMICFHFGTSQKRGSGQKRSYVGKGCGAFMNVSYNRGALRITQSHLLHNNHPPSADDQTPQRQLRVFNFTEELDLIVAKEVMNANPFEFANGEKQWIKAVERLKNDSRLANITPRLVKKRIRFLVDKFLAISHGRRPPPEDEMGSILYELDRTRKDTLDNPIGRGKKKRGPGRPRKRPISDDEDFDEEELISTGPPFKKRTMSSPSSSSPSTSTNEMTTLLTYLQKKDEEDRRLRQREIDLRKDELSFQKQRFEFEKIERKAHLDLLKAQLQAFEQSNKHVTTVAAKDANQVTEYTIVVDNNNQVLETMPTLG